MILELKINKIMLDKLQKVCYNVGMKIEIEEKIMECICLAREDYLKFVVDGVADGVGDGVADGVGDGVADGVGEYE